MLKSRYVGDLQRYTSSTPSGPPSPQGEGKVIRYLRLPLKGAVTKLTTLYLGFPLRGSCHEVTDEVEIQEAIT